MGIERQAMAQNSKIEWCDATWNPIRARIREDMVIRGRAVPAGKLGYHCERVSPGCKNCYAATMNGRMLPAWGTGLDYTVPNREKVEIFLDEQELMKPLGWRKPRRIFVESMSDWCATFVTDDMRDRIMAVAALCAQHTFLFLTKRSEECVKYFSRPAVWTEYNMQRSMPGYLYRKLEAIVYGTPYQYRNWVDGQWPLPNVWLGFSAENQQCFDERWSHMRKLAAAWWNVWCSAEPLLGPIDLRDAGKQGLGWAVVGGESGGGARPCNADWIRSLVLQCCAAGVVPFVKQLGAKPEEEVTAPRDHHKWMRRIVLSDNKGGDPSEWPEDLQVREIPGGQK